MRLFIAMDLPPSAVKMLQSLQRQLLQAGMEGRVVAPENLHLTLQFIGEATQEQADAICQAVQRAFADEMAPLVNIAGVSAFVRGTGDTVYARLAGNTPAIDRLQQKALAALRPIEVTLENRSFVPHITLLRNARFGSRNIAVRSESFFMWNISVYASHLGQGRGGSPRYECLCRVPLCR